jgi:hypothetical protein
LIKFNKEREKKEKERAEALARTVGNESLTQKGVSAEKELSETKKKQEQGAVKKAREEFLKASGKRKSAAENKLVGEADKLEEVEQEEKEETVPKKRKQKEKKGGRKMPVPCDDHGCQHMGITELKELPKLYLKTYVRKGNWLENTPCKDCAAKPEKEDGRVMDLATILKSKGEPMDDVARYCNFGVVAHSMEDEDAFKERFTCDMILCKDCYRGRLNKYEKEEQGRYTRRSRRVERTNLSLR